MEIQETHKDQAQESPRSLILLASVLALGLVLLWLYLSGQLLPLLGLEERVASAQFSGNIIEFRQDSVLMQGGYEVPGRSEFLREENFRTVEVVITPETEIVMFLVFLPTAEEIGEDGMYLASELKKERVVLSFDELKNQSGAQSLAVFANEDIYRDKKFDADIIELYVPVDPEAEDDED